MINKTTKKVVVGLNFGDEGKGLTTSFLVSETKHPLVVRFNGGHQAGHTVIHEGKRHVFSSFGSGSLQGAPTYWSSFCTLRPDSFLREYEILESKGITPHIFVNKLCPITTSFDVVNNKNTEDVNQHGSVGVGFGSTIHRHEVGLYKLYAQDLGNKTILKEKLIGIGRYYNQRVLEADLESFIDVCCFVSTLIHLTDDSIMNHYNPIFEGAQGILLDMDFGFFPNVTRSNTITKNAFTLMPNIDEVFYVTRSYLTRHGNGFLPGENNNLPLVNNSLETNVYNKYQGPFRTAELNVDLLNYALDSDNNFSKGKQKNLVITCVDQYPIDVDKLLGSLNTRFNNVYVSSGPTINNIFKYK